MTLGELIDASNAAVDAAVPGQRPSFRVTLDGVRRGRVRLFAGITGKVLGWTSSKQSPGGMHAEHDQTVVRVWADEVHRELVRRGLATPAEPKR